ncbi:MAG: acetyltransferase [Kiritimatiellaeota bacterium]|nr:acetyltransferase [Kiritimatiellota bacterium]
MQNETQLVIIGASGFSTEAAWILSRMDGAPRLAGFCDDDPAKARGVFNNAPLLGALENAAARLNAPVLYFCAVGGNDARKKITARADTLGWTPFSIVDPTAVVASDATLGAGIFLGVNSVVSCGAHIGNHVILNHNAVIGHNARVENFSHVCPGVKISGFCHVAEGAFLATNAVVIPSRCVGAWASVGAGCVVLRDLPDHTRLLPAPGKTFFN